jgi:hypothetical protein
VWLTTSSQANKFFPSAVNYEQQFDCLRCVNRAS